MKIGCNNYANNNCDYAVAFDFVIGRDAVSKTFGNLAIEKDDGAAGDQNNKSNNHPCYTERPVDFHKGIIAQFQITGLLTKLSVYIIIICIDTGVVWYFES